MTKKPIMSDAPEEPMEERRHYPPRRSPHEDCMAHSGIEKQLYIIIALGLLGLGTQAYAVMINRETRVEMAEFGGKVAVIESRVTALERAIKERDSYVYRQGD